MPTPPPDFPASPAVSEPPPRRRWVWWLLGLAGLLIAVGLAVVFLLDPWLRRTLEQQVSKQTHSQYQLHIGELRTSLWHRSIRLAELRLRPAAQVADTLPRLRLNLAHLRVTGVGLWALLRKQVVPVDSVVLDSARLDVLALPHRPTKNAGRPLHDNLPFRLKGLRIDYLGILRTQARYAPAAQPTGQFEQADVIARQLLISPTGAADTQRLAYAASWQLALHRLQARAADHTVELGRVVFATASQRLELDSLFIKEPAPGQGRPGTVRVNLTMPRGVLTGLRAAAWQHTGQFRADSLLLETPQLAFTPPAQPPPDLWKILQPLARRSDLAHLRVRNGRLRVQGLAHAPSVGQVDITGQGIRIDSLARQAAERIVYAQAWRASTGRIVAAFNAPYYRAESTHLRLNTAAHRLSLTGLALTPHFTPVQMNRRHGYQIPQFRARVAELAVVGLDFGQLVRHGQVHADRVTVREPVFRIASDGRGPINPHRSIITPEAGRRVHTRIDVRRLDLVNGNLYTRYRSPLSPVAGTISINRFNASLYNVSNDPRRQTARTPLTGTATAYLQNACKMTVHVAVPLLEASGRHRVWGHFGSAAFGILNPMTVPTRLVEFRKGNVQRIDFALQGDKQRVTGKLTARYTNLQLELLSYKQDEIKQSLGKKIISKAANVLVVRDQNPRKSGRLVTGAITSKREPRFSVLVLWRQGVVSGLFNSIGLPTGIAQKISQSQDTAPLPPAGAR